MEIPRSNIRILVVEDERSKRDVIVEHLMISGFSDDHIEEASNAYQAKALIEKFDPHILLLDLNIPHEDNDLPKIENADDVIKRVIYYNSQHIEKIKVIVVSGSVKDHGVQNLLTCNRDIISRYFDKASYTIESDEFKKDLVDEITKAIKYQGSENLIDYSFVRKSRIKELKRYHSSLWDKIDVEIFQEFEKLIKKDVNEHVHSQNVIRNCGEIVELIVNLLESSNYKIETHKVSDDYFSIRTRLNKLDGRKHLEKNRFEKVGVSLISRKSAYFASVAYYLRNESSHPGEVDIDNNKIFHGVKYSKEDAAISIDLIVPLIINYIDYLKKSK